MYWTACQLNAVASSTWVGISRIVSSSTSRYSSSERPKLTGQEAILKKQVNISCRSNGSITLDIHLWEEIPGERSIVVFIPSGPVKSFQGLDDQSQGAMLSALARHAGANVVSINYRASKDHRFPTPVHDVLTGYDWILENLTGSGSDGARDASKGTQNGQPAQIGVCGELLGGTLATMLALTECRLGTHRITAAAVNQPIVNWLFPNPEDSPTERQKARKGLQVLADEIAARNAAKSRKRPPAPDPWFLHAHNPLLSSNHLLHLRSTLFPHATDLFDRFASPTLFFRTPDASLPTATPDDTAASLSPSSAATLPTSDFEPTAFDAAEFAPDYDHIPSYPPSPPPAPSTLLASPALSLPCTSRIYHRAYPPSTASLRLPELRLYTSADSPLLGQHREFVALMRRSVAQGVEKQRAGEKDDARVEAEGRVEMEVDGEMGLWSREGWEERVKGVGEWFRGRIR